MKLDIKRSEFFGLVKIRLQNIGLGLKGTKWIMTGVAKTYLADVLLDGLCSLILSWNLLKGGFLPRP